MKKILGKLIRLSWPDKILFCKVIFLSLSVRIASRTAGFNATVTFLKRHDRKHAVVPIDEAAELQRYMRLLHIAERFPNFMVNCLSASTTFWWLLKRKGIETHMRFGMRKEGGKLLAHAWLEYKGSSLSMDPAMNNNYTAFTKSIL